MRQAGLCIATVWAALDIDRRRAVVGLLMTPVIHPAPKWSADWLAAGSALFPRQQR